MKRIATLTTSLQGKLFSVWMGTFALCLTFLLKWHQQPLYLTGIMALVFIFSAAVAGRVINSQIVNPLHHLTEYLNSVQLGSPKTSVTSVVVEPGNEIEELSQAMQALVGDLQKLKAKDKEQGFLEHEMRLSRAIQTSLLPQKLPQIPGLEVATLYRPAGDIGGDYFDFIDIDDDHMGVAIADVSGKSVSGAMLMTMTRNTLRSQAMQTLSPAEVISRTNRLLIPSMLPHFFVTLFYGVLDKRTMTLTFSNAGHPPILLKHGVGCGGGESIEKIQLKGSAMGVDRTPNFYRQLEERVVSMHSGDMAFLFTDGISESMNTQDQCLGLERLSKIILEGRGVSADELMRWVDRSLGDFSQGAGQSDDMTALVLRRS